MTRLYISQALRLLVTEDSGHRCGYCRCSEFLTSTALVIDHIVPVAAGGATVRQNLWRSCVHCNQYKATSMEAVDPATGAIAPLFNPRTQRWHEHFRWIDHGCIVEGLTPTGRATAAALRVNRDLAVSARRMWVDAGWHPPADGA
ncbi:MAG: HNH endonuclease [Ardenticatenales bacterium]|nr:HNH endonuclease [Ardenticatenales bacterium]